MRCSSEFCVAQVNEDATRLPLEVGKGEEPLGDIFLQLPAGLFESRDLVLQYQCCCKVQASLKRKGKRAICNATYSYF